MPDTGLPRWLAALPPRRRFGFTALSGLIASLGLAPFHLWPLALLGLALLFALARTAASRRQAALTGWSFGLGYFALALLWIVEPFFVDPWRHGWMAPFALLLMSGGLAFFWAAATAAAHRRGPLALIAALTLAELARAYVLSGFPWALLGYALTPSPLALTASLIGPHGLTLLTLTLAACLAQLLTRPNVIAAAPLAAALALLLAAPALFPEPPQTTGKTIRLIQPNAAQHEKWDADFAPIFWERQLRYTESPASPRPDLILWPETAIPWAHSRARPAYEMIAEAAAGAPTLLGVQRFDHRRIYNSAVLIGRGGQEQALYDKHHLVPFGEYMPLGNLFARVGIHGLAANDGNGYSPGPGPALIDIPGLGPALPLICYEAVFPQDLFTVHDRPALILHLTNDAWFGGFSGPQQHLDQARMRAIEMGLPLARAANTGISAMISPRGRITAQIPLREAGFTDAALPAPLPPTLYSRTGDWPALAAALLLLLATLLPLSGHRTPSTHSLNESDSI